MDLWHNKGSSLTVIGATLTLTIRGEEAVQMPNFLLTFAPDFLLSLKVNLP